MRSFQKKEDQPRSKPIPIRAKSRAQVSDFMSSVGNSSDTPTSSMHTEGQLSRTQQAECVIQTIFEEELAALDRKAEELLA